MEEYNSNNFSFNKEYNSNFSFNNAVACTVGCELYLKNICCNNDERITRDKLVDFMDLDDIINLRLTCKSMYSSFNKKFFKDYVKEGRITARTRPQFWMSNIDYFFVQKQVEKSIQSINCFSDSLYEKINISFNIQAKNKNISKQLNSYIQVIGKDLSRTLLSPDPKKNQELNAILERILIMTAYIRPEIGYCQGMNFVAAALLYFLNNEEMSFWLFITLLDKFELNLLYSKVGFINY